VQLMSEGFLPIATRAGTRGYLLPKLHVERCVLRLSPESDLHVGRSTRKKGRRFLLSVNERFDAVVAGCHRQHGENWLYPQIVNAFRLIHQRTREGSGVNAMVLNPETLEPLDVSSVRLYSIEVWNAETGALAGGELGYSVGGIYSSLTGFSNEDNAGSVQLGALGKLLMECGFRYWDLGMGMEYKTKLGAEMMRRSDFLDRVHRTRVEDKRVVLRCDGRRSAKELIDYKAPRPELRPAAARADVDQIPNGAEIEDGNPQGGGQELEQPQQGSGSQQRHHSRPMAQPPPQGGGQELDQPQQDNRSQLRHHNRPMAQHQPRQELKQPQLDKGSPKRHHNRPVAQPQPQQANESQRRHDRPMVQHKRDPSSPDRKPRAREEVPSNESTVPQPLPCDRYVRQASYDTDCSSTSSRAARKTPCDGNLDVSDRSNKHRRISTNSTEMCTNQGG